MKDPNQIDPSVLPDSHVEMLRAIHTLDIPREARAKLADLMDVVLDETTRRRRILALVQEALGQLRLDTKYLVFDLESTRRERDEALERK